MSEKPQFAVLVVDDEPAVTALLSYILQGEDMRVIVAHDGYKAMERLEEDSIDVVVTDIRMQGISGFDLLEHTQKTDNTIKVIMMTAYDSYEMVKQALRASAYDYLKKPLVDHDEIAGTVTRACENVQLTRENSALVERLQASNRKVNAANKRLLQLNKQLRRLAITDSLTLLYNRRYIDDWIRNYAFSNTSLEANYSIMLLDVDYFKVVNDSLGHDGSDKVLKHLASLLRNEHRDTDLVGRYGGEEFIVVMPGTDETESLEAAEKIRSVIESAIINVSSGPVKITVSIGLSTNLTSVSPTTHSETTSAEAFFSGRALVAQADKAMYEAKNQGRNCCIHYNQMPDEQNLIHKTS